MRSVIPALATAGLLGVAPGATAIETTADTVTVLVVSHGCQSGLVIPATVIDSSARLPRCRALRGLLGRAYY